MWDGDGEPKPGLRDPGMETQVWDWVLEVGWGWRDRDRRNRRQRLRLMELGGRDLLMETQAQVWGTRVGGENGDQARDSRT